MVNLNELQRCQEDKRHCISSKSVQHFPGAPTREPAAHMKIQKAAEVLTDPRNVASA